MDHVRAIRKWGRMQRRGKPRVRVALAAAVVILLLGALYLGRHTVGHAILSQAGYREAGGAPGPTQLRLPGGFHATLFATGLNTPRFAAVGPDGTLFVAERGAGRIVALPDPGHTGKAARTVVVADGLNGPSSLDFYQGALYVGEDSRISRFTLGPNDTVTSHTVVVPDLPTGGRHTTRTVLIGRDGHIYVSIGSSCDSCVESDPHRATVWVYNLDGSGGRLYARGLRNAVGMAINPGTAEIWVTNNGRDMLGDEIPPDTIYVLQDGGNYGWPRCHAGTVLDPDLGHPGDCAGVVQPLVKIQAHSAPLGLAFYTGQGVPAEWRGLYVAYHGSWNRSVPTGYKVVFIPLDTAGHVAGAPRDFATGWLHADDTATGRPVGLAASADGALYVTDDKAGDVYRITYTG